LIGFSSDFLTRFFTKTGLTPSQTYSFKYRVRNIYDWSPYSDPVDLIAAKSPDAPSTPSTSIVGNNVQITWGAPLDNGNAITAYKIEVLSNSGLTWSQDTTSCI
jgi:hypothetical protein